MTRKNLFCFLPLSLWLIQLSFLQAQQQWQINGANLYYNGGNVGIGLNYPVKPLHIGSFLGGELIRLQDLSTSGNSAKAVIGFYTADHVMRGFVGLGSSSHNYLQLFANTGNGVGFYTNGNNLRMTIHKYGNVGIGTGSPDVPLHIASGSVELLKLQDSDASGFQANPTIGFYDNNDDQIGQVGLVDEDEDFRILSKAGAGIKFGDFGSTKMFLNSFGNFGIGTVNPESKLHVNGGIIANGGVRLGNSSTNIAGTTRWSGSDFEGYNGSEWLSLTTQPGDLPVGVWVPAIQQSGLSYNTNPCATSCYNAGNLIAAADINGNVCKSSIGEPGTSVYVLGPNPYKCIVSSIQTPLGQCYCLLPGSVNNQENVNALTQDNSLEHLETNLVEKTKMLEGKLAELTSIVNELSSGKTVEETVKYNLSLTDGQLNQNAPNPFHDFTNFTTEQ